MSVVSFPAYAAIHREWRLILGMRQVLYALYLHVLLDSLNGFLSLVFHELFSLFLLLLHDCLLLQKNRDGEGRVEMGGWRGEGGEGRGGGEGGEPGK